MTHGMMVHRLAGTSRALVVGAALLAGATRVAAQDDLAGRALAALEACVAAAERDDEDTAKPAADEADRLYRELAQQPGRAADGLTGQARVRSQCRIPFVGMMAQGALVDESNELLERALRVEPTHFSARLVLGLNHYHTPGFLGRGGLAIEAFQTLLEQHGDATPLDVRMSIVYLLLGDMYEREDRRADAHRIWTMGAQLFPDEAAFAERLERASGERASGAGRRASESDRSLASASADSQATTDARSPTPDVQSAPVFEIDPLVVEAGGYSMDDARASTSITRMEVYTTPGGTADILQVFQTMPGVTRATEGSDLYVRGGEPAEAPVWVDGARLPYAGTFEGLHGGLFGVLDPSVLERAYFSSGGFSARYGDALSGVLDLQTEGRPTARSYRVGLNLVSLGAAYRTPIGEKAGAWAAVSGTETTALLAMQGDREDYPTSPRALQGIVSLIYQPAEHLELRTTTLREADETSAMAQALGWYGPMTADGATWLNTTSARWHDDATGSSIAATAAVAGRRTAFEFGVLDWTREDRTVSLRVDADRLIGSSVRVRGGVEGAFLDADQSGFVPTSEELRPGSPRRAASHDTTTHHAGGYVEAEMRPLPDLGVTAGLRADRLPGESALTLDPRAAVVYRLSDYWSVRAGTGIFHQGRWRTRLSLPDAGEAAGVARRAVHFAAGAQRDGHLGIRAEAFLKRYGRFAHDDGDAPRAVAGSARGIDLLASWDAGRAVSGWVSYSLLDGEIELADGTETSSRVDVTHTLTTVAKFYFADVWHIGGTARYATGRPFTPIVGQTTDPETGAPRPLFGDTYGERLPDYFRLDARLTRVVGLGGGFAAFYLEALNILGRSNVMDYTYDAAYEERREIASFFGEPTLVFGVEAQF